MDHPDLHPDSNHSDKQYQLRKKQELKKMTGLLTGGFLYLIWVKVTKLGIPCPIRLLTHLQCPGCGMTRAAAAVSRFQFAEALHYNVLSLTLMPLLVFLLGVREIRYIRTGSRSSVRKAVSFIETALIFLMYLAAVGYGIWRNLPQLQSWYSVIRSLLMRI